MTLQRLEPALALAREAVARTDSHPWFLLLAARCESRLGKPAAAAELAAQAVARDPDFIVGLAELCRFHKQAGALEAAHAAARQLARLRPHLPVMQHFFNTPDEPSIARPVEPLGPQTWLHGGDSGDLIYALAVMRDLGGPLYLGCLEGVREPMVAEKIAFLRPLLTVQPYLHGVHIWQGEAVSMDCNLFRLFQPEAGINLTTWQWRALRPGAPDLAQPWLAAPGFVRHGRPVFARTQRFRNPKWDHFWTELKQAAPDAIFVGTAAEYEDFGHGEFRHAADALELARMIAGASVFVGNQSMPYAIAEGLKVGRLLEPYLPLANCNFPGALPIGFIESAIA
jgi:tetratricopeptide (TPR) repeat protein